MHVLRVRDGQCLCATVNGASCRAASILETLGRPYALDILVVLANSGTGMRYNEMRRELDLAPNTLDRRLNELQALGAVAHGEDGVYALNAEGQRLLGIVRLFDEGLGKIRLGVRKE